jgi:hypothetical protein
MKKIYLSFVLLTIVTLSGCTHFEERLKSVSVSTKQDVFQEAIENSPIPAGYADITIVASLKTHTPGLYLFENSPHGTPDYQLLLNIDGQATKIKGGLREEDIQHRATRDPEAGRGIRYTFNRNLRVKSGPHKIAIALLGGIPTFVQPSIKYQKNQLIFSILPLFTFLKDQAAIGSRVSISSSKRP